MSTGSSTYAKPQHGASLLLAFKLHDSALLVIGSNTVAATRTFAALEAGATVFILAAGGLQAACPELRHRMSDQDSRVTYLPLELALESPSSIQTLIDAVVAEHPEISLACITDTAITQTAFPSAYRRAYDSAERFCMALRRHRIPVNVTDHPNLCTFTFPTTHRFSDPATGTATPLQIAIATNGQGCRLGTRLRRDLLSKWPKRIGVAVRNVGTLRDLARASPGPGLDDVATLQAFQVAANSSTPNSPVESRSGKSDSPLESVQKRMRWVAQISEYWPIEMLADLKAPEMYDLLRDYNDPMHAPTLSQAKKSLASTSHHLLDIPPPLRTKGEIFLIGSGTGHPSLLTVAARDILTQRATLVLSDKLVPSAVLNMIPAHVKTIIAKKFPGNADGAQNELHELAIDAARQGEIVARLKQGDPMVYGRAGEEILFFRSNGFEPTVIPGISSALAGSTFAGISVTQRGAAESFMVCTGVGRQGKEVNLPGYKRERTTVLLMGVARLDEILDCLLNSESRRREGPPYPPHLPIALIERASMPEQRVICSTLIHIREALTSAGEQRPPGLLVIGWTVLALSGSGDASILQEGAEYHDLERIETWLQGSHWKVTEGTGPFWQN